jgi:hypothetical protein
LYEKFFAIWMIWLAHPAIFSTSGLYPRRDNAAQRVRGAIAGRHLFRQGCQVETFCPKKLQTR